MMTPQPRLFSFQVHPVLTELAVILQMCLCRRIALSLNAALTRFTMHLLLDRFATTKKLPRQIRNFCALKGKQLPHNER